MTRIAKDRPVITVVNVFTVEPQNQQRLLNLLIRATTAVIRFMPGYVSANFHQSLDGRSVVNYAQWRSQEDIETMMQHPDVQELFSKVKEIATMAPQMYKVVFTDEVFQRPGTISLPLPQVGSA
ncbi:antibiotic biosynthesis monooxygenase family protein [Dictyobacter kobayashii]|uniref:Antibiotic biosynthesis monooxygenase n=1 Tax=Dictyobacter kobayashii TaxID=2014872 RepID=A0A402AHM3_9CHLR|nr:antibiotic biosynthesis monooxygenase family protein [Dictyobacter kobayashii]GCE18599.1 antibiotic biosynthesis monooxygenase [Dictyobacter kobayashii]